VSKNKKLPCHFAQTKTVNFSGDVTVDFILKKSIETLDEVVLMNFS
jgi:hypothetical protein